MDIRRELSYLRREFSYCGGGLSYCRDDSPTVEVHNFGKYSGKKFKGEVLLKMPV